MVGIDLSGKTAIITGAGRGIGKASALKFAEAGANVAVVDVNMENAESVAKEVIALGVESVAFDTDVTDAAAVDKMVDDVVAKFGKLDIMFNNAGCNVIVPFVESTLEQVKWLMDVNLFGVYNGCKAAVKHMVLQESGVILNTSSNAGVMASRSHTPYNPTKFAVRGLTQTLALELGPKNIRANAICPGIIWTDMWQQNLEEFFVGDGEEIDAQRNTFFDGLITDTIPLKRAGTVEEIANTCLFLVSDLAAYVTGQSWLVNGGKIMS